MNAQDLRTTDLGLAAFLHASGHKLKTFRFDGRRTEFTFEAIPEDAVVAFHNGAKIGARDLINSLRELKALAVEQKRR